MPKLSYTRVGGIQMPGLNQLKKFSEDIREIGDEVKIRAQRGEKVPVIPLPQGISEEDDSNDFIIGLPEKNKSSDAQGEEDLGSVEDVLGGDSDSSVDLDDLSGLDSDIAALLNPQAAADEDALADFLNDDKGWLLRLNMVLISWTQALQPFSASVPHSWHSSGSQI